MAVSLKASKQGLEKVDLLRKKKGWRKTEDAWCQLVPTSKATLKRFWMSKPILQETFVIICKVVGWEKWEEIVDETPGKPCQINQTSSPVRFELKLKATINEINKRRAEELVENFKEILEEYSLTLEKIKEGSVVLVLQGSQEGFEWAEYLFRTGELTELLGVPVLDVRLAPAPAPINWRQFLQNLFEPYWQQPEQLLPAGAHKSAGGSDTPEAILNLIQLLQTSQDEPTRRQAAEALGKTGTGNPNAISALTQLLRNSQDPETLWQAALSLGKLDPGNPAAGVERAKALDLGTQPDRQAVALIAAFRPKTDGEVSIRLRVEPVEEGQIYLPPNLKLTVFDESGEAFIQAESTSTDNFLQRGFSGPPELQFSVTISLGDASITEEFLT